MNEHLEAVRQLIADAEAFFATGRYTPCTGQYFDGYSCCLITAAYFHHCPDAGLTPGNSARRAREWAESKYGLTHGQLDDIVWGFDFRSRPPEHETVELLAWEAGGRLGLPRQSPAEVE